MSEGRNKRKDPPSPHEELSNKNTKKEDKDPQVIDTDGTESTFDIGAELASVREVYSN